MKIASRTFARLGPLRVTALVAIAATFLILPIAHGARSKSKPKPPPKAVAPRPLEPMADDRFDGIEKVDVGTRDVLERLKLLRVQMALDREEIAALQLRIAKIKLEREFENLLSSGSGSKTRTRRPSNPASDILVKAITLQPRKEAVIMYRGRLFTVRPGDRIGGLIIRDIDDSGIRVKGTGRSSKESTVR